jgi:hypothetical protein
VNDDVRDVVVASIRESLPEFARRNRIDLPDEIMDNLAYWAASHVPDHVYRMGCSLPSGRACACTGACQVWRRMPEQEPSEGA